MESKDSARITLLPFSFLTIVQPGHVTQTQVIFFDHSRPFYLHQSGQAGRSLFII